MAMCIHAKGEVVKPAAIITRVAGEAFAIRDGQEILLTPDFEVLVTDTLYTKAGAKVELRFHDQTEVDLGPLTRINVSEFSFNEADTAPAFGLHVLEGLVRTASGKIVEQNPEGFSLTTPMGAAGIRGTVIWVYVTNNQVVFTVSEMGEGHTVIITAADGRSVVLNFPESGVIITDSDLSPLAIFNMDASHLEDYLKQIFEDLLSSTHNGFSIQTDADFLAKLGVVGAEPFFVSTNLVETFFGILDHLGLGRNTPEGLLQDFGSSGPNPSPNPSPNPAPVFTSYIGSGDAQSNTLLGAMNQNHTYNGLAGNDLIVVYNGSDFIEGGYGSFDYILKYGDVAGDIDGDPETFTAIYGDEAIMNGVTSDASDVIIVRGLDLYDPGVLIGGDRYQYATMSGGLISGDGLDLTDVDTRNGVPGSSIAGDGGSLTVGASTAGDGDVISIHGFMTGGAIYGDARTFTATDYATYSLGNDQISIDKGCDENGNLVGGEMSGGVIYGDAQTASSANNNADIDMGADTIIITTLTGDGAVYGDMYSYSGINGSTCGDDVFIITTMSGGAIYGDAYILSGASQPKPGADTFTIGTLTGGAVYGDAHTVSMSGTDMPALGDDTFTITTMTGGAIYGDAKTLSITADHSIDAYDTFTITNMVGGAIYGEAESVTLGEGSSRTSISSSYNNQFIVTQMTGGELYGAGKEVALYNAVLGGSDNSTMSSTFFIDHGQGGTIHGVAKTLHIEAEADTTIFSLLSPAITVKIDGTVGNTAANMTIYGAAENLESLTFLNDTHDIPYTKLLSPSIKFDADSNTDASVNNCTIYGVAKNIGTISASDPGGETVNLVDSFNPTITMDGHLTNTTIYGISKTIGPISLPSFFGTADGNPLTMAFAAEVTINGTLGAGSKIYTSPVITGDFNINGSNDPNDYFGDLVTVNTIAGGLVDTGIGNDKVTLNNAVGTSYISLGKGADVLYLHGLTDGAVLHLDFGDDDATDKVDLDSLIGFGGNVTIHLYNFNNAEDSFFQNSTVWTITDTTQDTFTVSLGSSIITCLVASGPFPGAPIV